MVNGRVSVMDASRDMHVSKGPMAQGLSIRRLFTTQGREVFDTVEWERRDVVLTNDRGVVIFEQRDVEVPKRWSQMATQVVVNKYFRGQIGTGEREKGVKQLISRVTSTIRRWGKDNRYFNTDTDAAAFESELGYLLLHQYGSFNSPVWFNVGIEAEPQCSACFINEVDDTMESILELAKTEGMLFKYGSGTGTNLSPIRSSKELLSKGGMASGPVSFMKGWDSFAGVIKSGGKTRRAAKMVILNIDHPDIKEFIECKAREEKKAWALIEAGYDGSFDGEAYSSVFFQNANNSVRVTDSFMESVLGDGDWLTKAVTNGEAVEKYKATELMDLIAESAHLCGDPGIQFDTTVNKWHTCPASGRINASNPCSEFMFLDNSSCNLASLNLKAFLRSDGTFDVEKLTHAVSIFILAQEIIVDNAGYPTTGITKNSKKYRPLGLGYANLGALLMALGLPYDSDEGRAYAATVTAMLTGQAYLTSSWISQRMGPFDGYKENQKAVIKVLGMHRDHVDRIQAALVPTGLLEVAKRIWDDVVTQAGRYGVRNAQATVLAPTGTIGFMMDCDTTGVEPDIALVKYKKLVGGGTMRIVNKSVPEALRRLGYGTDAIEEITKYIDQYGTVEGAPSIKEDHLPVFDCAFKPKGGTRSIHYMGHIRMMGAVQPFISGAISKTVNMPNEATPAEVKEAYVEAWRQGLKAIAIYRDGSKRIQPLTTGKDEKAKPAAKRTVETKVVYKPLRRRLPDERQAVTHKFNIAGHEGYLTVGMFDEGQPGEIFVVMAKQGSVVSGLTDAFATAISIALQYGVPLKELVKKFSHLRFEPSGFTSNREIPIAKSIIDYLFRYLDKKFLVDKGESVENKGYVKDLGTEEETADSSDQIALPLNGFASSAARRTEEMFVGQEDAPPCAECGEIMVRSGSCYKCLNCGSTSGCS